MVAPHVQRIQATNPLRMRAVLAEIHRLEQFLDIGNQPTRTTDAICLKDLQASPKVTRPVLPIDKMGRPYVKIKVNNGEADTLRLIQAVVQRYYEVERRYPFIILLSKKHYTQYGRNWQMYYVPHTNERIPFAYEGEKGANYDVMARG